MASVEIKNGYKYYGSLKNKNIILNNLNMNVETGSIYSLLGPSGCGKTTLLSCIVGQKQLNSGDIKILGLKPGLPGSGIPGPLVGYMPQEIALVDELTIKETIYYFGRIYDMEHEKIRDRYIILKHLLDLPPPDRLVMQCSGGQKRRVSFVCALIHEPQILILDEPTVGLDPLLREKIWDFLQQTTHNNNMSVIITTHYIEEATKANRIGLMRNGVLVAEDTPINIMNNLECRSLEEAFLKLSKRQGSDDVIKNYSQSQVLTHVDSVNPIALQSEDIKSIKHKRVFTTKNRMKALLTKSINQFSRQPSLILFMFLFPIVVMTIFYLAIGLTPRNLRIGIVNDEVKDFVKCFNKSITTISNQNIDTCEFINISCLYLMELDSDYVEKIFYNSNEEAYKIAKQRKITGYIHFPQNFSKSMQNLIEFGKSVKDDVLKGIQLNVRLDMTDQQTAYFVQRRLLNTYQKFAETLMIGCGLPKSLASIPVNITNIFYGPFDVEYQKFLLPGVLITLTFFLSAILSSVIFVCERENGIWDRTQIAGVSTIEILLAHLICQGTIMIIQILETLLYCAFVFNLENQGSNLTLFSMLILNGFCGLCFGFLISIYCPNLWVALYLGTAAFYPLLLLSGFLWPVEGMHIILKDVVYGFPFTLPVSSMRNILDKGWSILNFEVYKGFIGTFCWIFIFIFLCVLRLKGKI